MKKIKFLMLAVMAVALCSCGSKGDDNSFDVTVDNTTIGGKLSEYFSLADKTYKYNKSIIDKVTVELTCIKPLPENMKAFIGVEVLDEDGTVISAGKADVWSFDDYKALQQASAGETVTIEISNHQNVKENTPAKIRLCSVVEEDETAKASADSSDEEVSESSSSSNIDKLLDSYERYVDDYIALAKKAQNGDMNALAEYPKLLQDAQDMQSQLDDCKGDLTSAQVARMGKITAKMAKAAQ